MKKKLIPILVCLVLSLCFALTGCGDSYRKIDVSGKQDTSYTVYSNGGMAVQYGNYVYFINGFDSYDDADGKANLWPDVVKGGLYRAELTGERQGNTFVPSLNTNAATDGMEFVVSQEKDYLGNNVDTVNVQLIAPKRIGTSGYAKGGIFIYDEWVYFASPNNEKDKTGVVQTTRTDFYRAKLDGSKVEKVFTTANSGNESNPYAFYKYNGAVYLVAQDGTDVVSVRIAKKAENKVTIAQNITNVLLPYSETYYSGMSENTLNHFVYVLRAVTDDDYQKTGNVIEIMRPDGKEGGVYLSQGKSDTLEAVRDGMLFYRTTDTAGNTVIVGDNLHDFLMGENGDKAYKEYQTKLAGYVDKEGKFNAGVTDAQKAEYNEYALEQINVSMSVPSEYTTTYCMRPSGEKSNLVYILGVASDAIYLKSQLAGESNNSVEKIYNGSATFLNVVGNYVYFYDTSDNSICRTLWQFGESEKETVSTGTVYQSHFNADYCAGYLVYMGNVDALASNYTLFKRVDMYQGIDAVFVGKKTEAETLAKPVITLKNKTLSWDAVANANTYMVYTKNASGEITLVEESLTETSYDLTNATAGEYWVVAVDSTGELFSTKSDSKNI